MKALYECAAKVPEEQASKHVNDYGNISAKSLGCGGDNSWVAPYELRQMREGKLPFLSPRPFDWARLAMTAFAGFAATLLLVSVALGAVVAARWVWAGNKRSTD